MMGTYPLLVDKGGGFLNVDMRWGGGAMVDKINP